MDAGEAGAGAGVLGATTAAEPVDPAYETQSARPLRSGGASSVALAAGLAAIALLAGAGWYAANHSSGAAEHPAPAVAP
jgi:hypothetical protein